MEHTKQDSKAILQSLGLVFGDIGTSPIYTLTVIFLLTKPTETNVLGVLSLIVWTLVILVTIEYAWLAMSLGMKGEGGTIVLRELLTPLLKSSRHVGFVTLLSFIGISLLIGDGVITPAISILSAVEGIILIPGMNDTPHFILLLIAGVIAVILFSFQKKGTEKVAGAFGPLMVIWFSALTLSGLVAIWHAPRVFKAINPYYAMEFMLDNGIVAFFVLSEVILCATGGEALYADMGHLGRKPILQGWSMVFLALVVNYLGQGAFLILHPDAQNVLFEMIFDEARFLYIPFLILSIMATVIASQAMISGMFSIIYQGITTRVLPLLKVDYTSRKLRSQIYIGFVNWALLSSVIFIIILFKESKNLAAAYGLAVTGTMTITGIMMSWIFHLRRDNVKFFISVMVTCVDLAFLLSNTYKLSHGGYWSIIIASFPLAVIVIYKYGQQHLYLALKPLEKDIFLGSYNEIYERLSKIKGTSLFFARDMNRVPPYIVHTMLVNNIIYEDNVIVSMTTSDSPFGTRSRFKEPLAKGLRTFEVETGYMEVVDLQKILMDSGINAKAIFYGIEDINTGNFFWKIFSIIKKLSPSFVQFYKMPSNRLHGVITRVEM